MLLENLQIQQTFKWGLHIFVLNKSNILDSGSGNTLEQEPPPLGNADNDIEVISIEPTLNDQRRSAAVRHPLFSRHLAAIATKAKPNNVETIPIRATMLSALFFLPSIVVVIALYAENVSPEIQSISIEMVVSILLVLRCSSTTFATFKSRNKVSIAPTIVDQW